MEIYFPAKVILQQTSEGLEKLTAQNRDIVIGLLEEQLGK